jgi:uncharacterized membrane protein (UPF0127 family)
MSPARLRRLPRRRLGEAGALYTASTFRARLLGLALLRAIAPGTALLIPRCRSVHTFGMRFRLDVAFLDASGHPLRVEHSVPPRRLVSCRGAAAVLEARAGEVELFLGEALVG